MMSGTGRRRSRSSWLGWLGRWAPLDHVLEVAWIASIVLAFGLFYAAFANHEYVLDWTVVTSLRHLKHGADPSGLDLSKLEAGAQVFESARSKLLSADAMTFLLALMSFIAITLPVTVIFGVNRKIKRAKGRIDQAHQISRGLASVIGATSAGQLALTLAGMVDRNMDRLASELAGSAMPGQGGAVAGVMGDWLKSLKDALGDPDFVEIGIPRPAFDGLCESVARIDDQLRNIDRDLQKDLLQTRTTIDGIVLNWLESSEGPQPHDPEEGARRLREIALFTQNLQAEGCTDETLASKIEPRLLPHELTHYAVLMLLIDKFKELDAHLHRVQTHHAQLHRLKQTVNQCHEALHEDIYRRWEDFITQLKDE